MAESKVEGYLVDQAKARGGLALKWVSPGTAGVMDRLVLLPVPPEHREIVNRYVKLVETKDLNKVPRPLQERVAGWITERGYRVHVADRREKVDEVFK